VCPVRNQKSDNNWKREVKPLGKQIIFCTGETLGDGKAELGKILMRNFFYALAEGDNIPEAVIFMNRGVFLALESSEIAQSLQKIAGRGVEVLACGTCLDYYGLKEKPLVGEVSNMGSITELLGKTEQVVTL